jgi:hypothetical protein
MHQKTTSVIIDSKTRLLEEVSANSVLHVVLRPPSWKVVGRIRIYRIACLLGENAVRQQHVHPLPRVRLCAEAKSH